MQYIFTSIIMSGRPTSSQGPSGRPRSETTNSTSQQTTQIRQPDDNQPDRHEESSGPPSTSNLSTSSESDSDSRSLADIPSDLLVEDESPKRTGVVHGHALPSGWSCKYDPDTDHYSFELDQGNLVVKQDTMDRGVSVRTPTKDDVAQTSRRPTLNVYECQYGFYHFPTTPTSSMISELAKQVQKRSAAPPTAPKTRQVGYGKHKLTLLSSEEEQAKRLNEMFPTATMPIIEQMIRIYHGREGLIKAALISLGYKRSTEYSAKQSGAHSPIMLMMSKPSSKKLFDKLVSYFPDKDETLIKGLMFKHKEVEHEIISALVESSQEGYMDQLSQSHLDGAKADKSGAIMKLRYLKFLYPTCEEIELYHLLHCNDLNAQRVMEHVEKKGHKRANIEEVMQNRRSQTQQMRAQQIAHAVKDKPPSGAIELVEAHQKRPKPTVAEARIINLKENLKKTFKDLDDGLLVGALEATDYNEGLARKFLEQMEPVDDSYYKQRYQLHREVKPDVVAFPCKSIQKSDKNFMSIVSNEHVYIARQVIECDNALALLKVDASTFTGDDFEKVRFSHRQGAKLGLAVGSIYKNQPRARESRSRPPRVSLMIGSKYEQVCSAKERPVPNKQAAGHNKSLARGRNVALNCGHNAGLLERTHPFYIQQVPN